MPKSGNFSSAFLGSLTPATTPPEQHDLAQRIDVRFLVVHSSSPMDIRYLSNTFYGHNQNKKPLKAWVVCYSEGRTRPLVADVLSAPSGPAAFADGDILSAFPPAWSALTSRFAETICRLFLQVYFVNLPFANLRLFMFFLEEKNGADCAK